MKLAVLAPGDPFDVRTWSGTPYHMTKALQSSFPDLLPIIRPTPSWDDFTRRVVRKASAGQVELAWNKSVAKLHADRVMRTLKSEHVDVVLCIASSPLSAYISQHIPTIYVSDATVPLMRDYYSEFSRLLKPLATNALELDSTSVRQSRCCLYPTDWAANSAIRDYGADPSHVHVIPWGCNIEKTHLPSDQRHIRTDQCNLVFIGLDWQRKGGDIAVDAVEQLLDFGCYATLDIIGAKPNLEKRLDPDTIVEHGFINKGTKEGLEKFNAIMKRASFLFVPTRQDCYGLVFAEASAYGVPVITTRTGGVPGVVEEGVNGHMLPTNAGADQYARLIWNTWSDVDRYDRLRVSSRKQFEEVLNWDSWLVRATGLIEAAALWPG